MHIIIEGIDHCGKDTLINTLQQYYGGRVYHSGKPVVCEAYLPKLNEDRVYTEAEINKAKALYQERYFQSLFDTMCPPKHTAVSDFRYHKFNVYYNRLHLGEYVYGYLYRNYSQSMMDSVFRMERELVNDINWIRLILLAMHHPEIRDSDPDAFNNENGAIEQQLFFTAFNKSILHKAVIFVDTPFGKWRPTSDILNDVLAFMNPLETAPVFK